MTDDSDWTEAELMQLADLIGNAIEDGTADAYRRAYRTEEDAFEAFARDHLPPRGATA